MNSLQLHKQLVQHLTAIGIGASQPVNLALLCQALAVSPNCHLATLALGLPLPGQREHLIQRLHSTFQWGPTQPTPLKVIGG